MMGYGRGATSTAMTQASGPNKSAVAEFVSKPRNTEFIIEDAQLTQTMPAGALSGALSGALMSYVESPLPPAVANVPKEDVRSFLHHKRVGNYLLGRTLGEGSFAKVKEGMHSLTGEKVRPTTVTDLTDCTFETLLADSVPGAHACKQDLYALLQLLLVPCSMYCNSTPSSC